MRTQAEAIFTCDHCGRQEVGDSCPLDWDIVRVVHFKPQRSDNRVELHLCPDCEIEADGRKDMASKIKNSIWKKWSKS